MSGKWNYIKFGDLFDYENKSKIKAGDGLNEGAYPFYTSSVELTKYINEFQFDNTSLVFGTGGNASIHYVDIPFSVSTDCLVAFAKDSMKAYAKFVYYYISGNINLLEEGFKGAGLKHISKGYINEILIPLPPLAIQKRIAEILDAADALRRKDQELLKKYDELAQAIFIDMFGDPVKNEKGWDVKSLRDISTKIHSGNTPKGGSNVYVDKGITFFRSQNVWKNNLVYEDIAFIDHKTHKSMQKSSLKNKDILMTKTGRINTENSSLGRAAIYLGEDDKANVNGHVYLIRLQRNQIHEFVVYILTSKEYRDLIREVCVGGIDKRQLNKDHIENFPIIYPPIESQKNFQRELQNIWHQKTICKNSLINSESIFNSLIPKAFNGELVS